MLHTNSLRAVVIAALLPLTTAGAQAALGTPFIGNNTLTFQAAGITRNGGAEMTTVFGAEVGHRFGAASAPTRASIVVRAAARALGDTESGVLDVGAAFALSHEVAAVQGLAFAASAGLGLKAWGDAAADRGRAHLAIPASAGMSYDLRVRSATLTPFAMGTVNRYDLRTSVNDERESVTRGWDAGYTTGVSLRLREVVLTSSRIVGEYGMPQRARWSFAAGISY